MPPRDDMGTQVTLIEDLIEATKAPEATGLGAITAQLMDYATRAHTVLSCRGYSRSDFIVTDKGAVFLETNTLPGLTAASLYPKALKAHGIEFVDFLNGQIALAEKQASR